MGTTQSKSQYLPKAHDRRTPGPPEQLLRHHRGDVDQLADRPTMAYAKLNTHDLEWDSSREIKPGASFKVRAGLPASREPIDLFNGTVHGWEPQSTARPPPPDGPGINKLNQAPRVGAPRPGPTRSSPRSRARFAGAKDEDRRIQDTEQVQPYIYQANVRLDFLPGDGRAGRLRGGLRLEGQPQLPQSPR